MEEMVAEFGACLLASECHFKSDISRDNAENYVVGWYQYIKDHPNALVNAMAQAQKACDYILLKDAKSTSCDNDIEIAV
jgi:antirestriction protein ArdC